MTRDIRVEAEARPRSMALVKLEGHHDMYALYINGQETGLKVCAGALHIGDSYGFSYPEGRLSLEIYASDFTVRAAGYVLRTG